VCVRERKREREVDSPLQTPADYSHSSQTRGLCSRFEARLSTRAALSAAREKVSVLNLRTTTSQKCEAVPRRACI